MHTSTPLAAQQLAAYAAFAQTLADRVRPLSRQWFRHPLSIDTKADESPVTQADREVEAALRAAISQQYPEHGIFGEEYGVQQAEAEFVWSLDPIDGTRAFISGNPLWGTLLALLYRGKPVLGLIDVPMLDERWIGTQGRVESERTALFGQPLRKPGPGHSVCDFARYLQYRRTGRIRRPGAFDAHASLWRRLLQLWLARQRPCRPGGRGGIAAP